MKICDNCGYENEDIRQTCELCGADLTEKEHGNGLVIGLLCTLIAVVIIAAVAIGLVYYNSDSQVYLRAMSKGNSEYDLGNYSEALNYYLTALSVGEKEEEVYLKLAETYIALEDEDSALAILEQGNQSIPTSTRISTRLSEYRNTIGSMVSVGSSSESDKASDDTASYTYEEAVEMSENVTFNDSMFATFAEYSYADYRTNYSLNVRANTDSSMTVELQNTGITLCYYSTDENPNVVNVAQGVPRSYAKPTVIELSDLSVLFHNYEGAVTGERLSELLNETITASWNEQESRYEIYFNYMDCIVTLETDSDGNILKPNNAGSIQPEEYTTEEETTTEETTTVEDATVETEPQTEEETTTVLQTADVSGYITDAATGSGIEGAAVAFKQSGSTVLTVFTEVDGYYIATVAEGSYVVEVSCEGYITESFEITVVGNENLTFQNLTISQELETGTIRIVLEWGEYPRDLDSHTEGTFSNGNSFHVYYGSKRAGTADTDCYAELDVDDTSSYGPETTTVYDVDAEFTFYVYNFSGESEQVAYFGNVTVKVYIGDSLAATYTGPEGTAVKQWNVFSYSDGVLTPLLTYTAL